MTHSSLPARAARGAAVTALAQVVRIVVQFGSVPILARLVGPADTGVFAMVLVVIGLGEILRDAGLSQAVIQSPTFSTKERDNLFWLNTAIGLSLALTCFALATPIAHFYDEPALVEITRVMSLMFVLNALATQHRASLVRDMKFRALAVADSLPPVLGLLAAVTLAATTDGPRYWALVGQSIVGAGAGLLVAVVLGHWLPRWPHRGTSIRRFVSFGLGLVGSQIVTYSSKAIDTVILGYRFGKTDTGYYTKPYQTLTTVLNQVRSPSTSVALPALSRVQDDQQRFAQYVTAGQITLAMPLSIMLAIVVGAADPTVRIALGAEWLPSVPVLQLLAVAGLFQTLAFVGYWVYLARAKTTALMYFSTVSAVIKVACVLVGGTWGFVGVAAAGVVAAMIDWPLSLWWLGRVTPVPVRALYGGALRTIALAIPTALCAQLAVLATSTAPTGVQWLAGVGAGLGAAALVAACVPPIRRDAQLIARIITLALRRK